MKLDIKLPFEVGQKCWYINDKLELVTTIIKSIRFEVYVNIVPPITKTYTRCYTIHHTAGRCGCDASFIYTTESKGLKALKQKKSSRNIEQIKRAQDAIELGKIAEKKLQELLH